MCDKQNKTVKISTIFIGQHASYRRLIPPPNGTKIDSTIQQVPATDILHFVGSECIVSVKQTRGARCAPLSAIIGTIAGINGDRLIINAPDSRVGTFQLELTKIKKVEVVRFWCDRNE